MRHERAATLVLLVAASGCTYTYDNKALERAMVPCLVLRVERYNVYLA